ncbi:hypothetical protein HIM_09893 [Hirsutella minnesotensis 3608]|uniref:F-box domain-containing protein n=1 Tax=Hirsutella minnesotensis 3608 TaxID=1043627 RepID=A0A0F8A2U6_9HYPO|nr:hypothetical protein HIM_09893 [Hirsutella minnesotensis 3608]
MLQLKQYLERCRASILKGRSLASATHAGSSQKAVVHAQSPPRDDPRPGLEQGFAKIDAPLERLPAEVRRQLLCLLELDDLHALVSVSPVFHDQYKLDSRFVLCTCLDNTLRDIAIDAWAVFHSGQADFLDSRNDQAVMQLLQTWQSRSKQADYSLLSDSLKEDEVVSLVEFHTSIITPLAHHYVSWALDNLASESGAYQSRELKALSRTERARLTRAFYRFQLCCNLFGGRYHKTIKSSTFQAVDVLKLFFCIFEPWQIEEIACVYVFTKIHYDEVFREVAWDLSKENPRLVNSQSTGPDGVFDLEDACKDTRRLLQGTTSCGLKLLHTVLFQIQDHVHLVSIMQQNISWPAENFLGNEALGERAQFQRRQEHPMERDLKQQRRDPLPFKGDRCYVFWDAPRLERTGGREVLARQWEADWGLTDPRDFVM